MLMWSRKLRFCGLFPLKIFEDVDNVSGISKTAKSVLEDDNNKPTGWDRLYQMFSVDEFGTHSPELHVVYQAGFYGAFIGACIGGFLGSKAAYLNFMDTNQATAFKSHLDAKKKLQDQVTISFARGAFKWGWRLGLFSGSYMLVSTALSVYRGKSSVLEYVAAGCVTGALYKFNLGPRGMLVGGLMGSVLGLMAGGCSLALLDMTGASIENVRFWQYKWKEQRLQQQQAVFKARDEMDDSSLLKAHNKMVGPSGESLATLDAGESVDR
ncbi:RPII140-upstream gene protein [Bacillus rossius redtenbacheri]|uniref:RPII140-upstream gene protein n=1 Tax=Bacillus rossius redtenbacheri TaxID=93214 RepID=UPI002FDD1C5B